MTDPDVSIIIPTYRRPARLTRAVESVCNQTYDQWELYVVNDAPDHDIVDVLPSDERIKYIRHKENKGAPAARNTGIQMSEGPYVALLDDDDAWKPEKLERQVNHLQQLSSEYGLVYTGADIIRDEELIKRRIPESTGDVFRVLLHHNIVISATPLIRRECFEKVGYFDTDLLSSQDLDMWLRIAQSYKMDAVTESLAIVYKCHGERISENSERKYQGQRRILEKYEEHLKSNPEALSRRLKLTGSHAIRSGRASEAKEFFKDSLRYNPFQPDTVGYLFLSLIPIQISHPFLNFRDQL